MRFNKIIVGTCVALLTLGLAVGSPHVSAFAQTAKTAETVSVAVGPQYDTTHVYVAPEDFDRFVASLLATFGGTTTKQFVLSITPTPSSTMWQLVMTPAGNLSVLGFKTPIPYPFGAEKMSFMVTDMDAAIRAARANGADVFVEPFNDPIGRDAVIQWPGGVITQLYWHTTAPSYTPLQTIPENHAYVSADRVHRKHPCLHSRQTHLR
jgi:predicted enzyme related to lactoylglutathione lyase